MEGAAVANAVTFALSKWARLYLVKKFVDIQPYDRDYFRLLVPAASGAAVMWLFHETAPGGWLVDLAGTAGFGTLAFALVYVGFGLTRAERNGLRGLTARLRAR
jgi:hypothetical protein